MFQEVVVPKCSKQGIDFFKVNEVEKVEKKLAEVFSGQKHSLNSLPLEETNISHAMFSGNLPVKLFKLSHLNIIAATYRN